MNKFTTSVNGPLSNSLEEVMDLNPVLKVGKTANYEMARDQVLNSKRGILHINDMMAEDENVLSKLVRDKEFSNTHDISAGNK